MLQKHVLEFADNFTRQQQEPATIFGAGFLGGNISIIKNITIMKVEIKGGELIIRMPINKKPVPSKSTGKTLMIASSGGPKLTEAEFDGQQVTVGLNAWIKPKA